jgi:enoyl-CoA hydratase/carnithine racemase
VSTPITRPDAGRDEGVVTLERTGAVALLTLARPAALNAITWTMYEQLVAHLDALAGDSGVHAIVLRGSGTKAFASGTDISQFQTFTGADGVAYERRVDAIMGRLTSMPQPLIAAIHGYAVGGGMAIAMTCDLRYATAGSRFGIPVARTLGNCLSLGNYRRLAEAIGAMRAKELLFTGRLLSAEEALRDGFLTAILDDAEFFERVRAIAGEIAANAPLTIWATKQAFARTAVTIETDQSDQSAGAFDDVIERVYGSADFHEGVRAHLEKRRPVWRGE